MRLSGPRAARTANDAVSAWAWVTAPPASGRRARLISEPERSRGHASRRSQGIAAEGLVSRVTARSCAAPTLTQDLHGQRVRDLLKLEKFHGICDGRSSSRASVFIGTSFRQGFTPAGRSSRQDSGRSTCRSDYPALARARAPQPERASALIDGGLRSGRVERRINAAVVATLRFSSAAFAVMPSVFSHGH